MYCRAFSRMVLKLNVNPSEGKIFSKSINKHVKSVQ